MCHIASPSHFVGVNQCTLVLDGQKWSLFYQKVHANRVIRRHLCMKPMTFEPAKKICPHNPRVCVMRVCVNEVLLHFHRVRHVTVLPLRKRHFLIYWTLSLRFGHSFREFPGILMC